MRGYATNFADPGDLARYRAAIARGASEQEALSVGDNGVGSPNLGSISTSDAYGIAVPTSYLRANFGSDPAAWRTARNRIVVNGQEITVPYIDIGPGKGPQARGVIADLSYPLSQAVGGTGRDRIELNPVANAGPDYLKDQEGWQAEQAALGSDLHGGSGDPAGQGKPYEMTDEALDAEINRIKAAEALLNIGGVDLSDWS